MHIYLGECDLHVEVLAEALEEAHTWLPFSAETIQNITKSQLRILDQIAYRFTKLQDTMGQKVLPTILELAQEPIAPDSTFAEKLNWLERMGALPSSEELKKLRVARNAIVQEYPDDRDLRSSAINRFIDGAMQLNALYVFVSRYILEHFPNVENSSE
ncbi:MAG: hypothetical protein HOP23_18945 [Methylococcaceae bacterium]|nr:hypothetical protein [Methylococcaceae bacterium]